MRDSPISATVDFDREGVQHGHLKLPYSHDRSAWGSVMIPVTVARRGDGPTALLTGGNHGDEYEGPIALFNLAAAAADMDLSGRVIIVPGMNYPAFAAGRRNSPIDGLNMNRVFPGRPDGSPTEKIADYFQRTLLPMADYVLDYHSGGSTLYCVPFSAAHILDDKEQEGRCIAAMNAFGAPYTVMLLEIDPDGLYDTAAERQGKVFVTTELGGGGTSTSATAAIAQRGLSNFLKHAGLIPGPIEAPAEPPVALRMPDDRCLVLAEHEGMVEYCASLEEQVREGQVIARIHDIRRTGGRPAECRARTDGLFIVQRSMGLAAMGDVVAAVGVPA